MPERNLGRNAVPSALDRRKAELAGRPSPPIPDGAAVVVANRIMTYARQEKTKAAVPYIDRAHGGLIISGADPGWALETALETGDGLTLLNDPAGYEKHTATVGVPFVLPSPGLVSVTLDDVLDRQLRAGAAAALSPTGYIPPGGIDVLREAARQFRLLGRSDAIFTAPLDVSLMDAFYVTTSAILEDLGAPIALILGGQGDPLKQSAKIIPNLRDLSARVALFPIRTDFNAMDLVAHGAIGAAIGTGGSLRHTVNPADGPRAFSRDQSPSVLWPELASWFKGSKINELFGARPSLAPWCDCAACGKEKQRLTRFLRREHQDEAISHAIATWSGWAEDLLSGGHGRRARSLLAKRVRRCGQAPRYCPGAAEEAGRSRAAAFPAALGIAAGLARRGSRPGVLNAVSRARLAPRSSRRTATTPWWVASSQPVPVPAGPLPAGTRLPQPPRSRAGRRSP